MEKQYFTIEQALSMDLPPLIIYAAPVMFILVLIEWYIRTRELKEHYDTKDGFSAFAIGLGNIGVSALVKVLLFAVILFFLQYGSLVHSARLVVLSFVYCGHRFLSVLVPPVFASAAVNLGHPHYAPQFGALQLHR